MPEDPSVFLPPKGIEAHTVIVSCLPHPSCAADHCRSALASPPIPDPCKEVDHV